MLVRVMMLTPGLPQPTGAGAAIRNWHILRFLTQELGARVHIFAFGEPEATAALEPLPAGSEVTVLPRPARDRRRRLHVLARSTQPDLTDRLWIPEVQSRVVWEALNGAVDLVHIGGLEVGRYGREVIRHRPDAASPAVVLDDFNAEYVLQRRAAAVDAAAPRRWPAALYSTVQWARLRAFERDLCRAADAVVCVSRADAAALGALGLAQPPAVIPNGVDTERYHPAPAGGGDWPHFDLLFSGTFDYRPNVDAARWLASAVWPGLRARAPRLTLGLVGQRPAPAVQALAALPGVTVTGAVPDDRPYLWGARLYVVPMRYGGGVRLKLLNALAAGCPVVSTAMGAEGIAAEPGRDLLLADEPAQWVGALGQVLGDPVLRAYLRQSGQALVAARYEWAVLARGFGHVYERALAARGLAAHAGEHRPH